MTTNQIDMMKKGIEVLKARREKYHNLHETRSDEKQKAYTSGATYGYGFSEAVLAAILSEDKNLLDVLIRNF